MTQLLIEHAPSPMKLEVLNVDDWPTIHKSAGMHTCSVGESETYYIEEGDAEIQVDGEQPLQLSSGDLLTILPDTDCVWHVKKDMTIHQSISSSRADFQRICLSKA